MGEVKLLELAEATWVKAYREHEYGEDPVGAVLDGLHRLVSEIDRQHILHDNLRKKHHNLRAKYDIARSELASLKAVAKLRKEIGR